MYRIMTKGRGKVGVLKDGKWNGSVRDRGKACRGC